MNESVFNAHGNNASRDDPGAADLDRRVLAGLHGAKCLGMPWRPGALRRLR
jgi:hypothetical protein